MQLDCQLLILITAVSQTIGALISTTGITSATLLASGLLFDKYYSN
jgi:hypothetical protein